MNQEQYEDYIKRLRGRERKSYNALLKYVNTLLPKEEQLPTDFTKMSIPADNIRLYNILQGEHKLSGKATKDFNTRELDIEITGIDAGYYDAELRNILKGYQDLFRKHKEINNEEAFNTRILTPFLAEVADYYVANLPELLHNIIGQEYKLKPEGKFFSGKSEDISKQIENTLGRKNIEIAIAPYAADWVGVHTYIDPNNNFLQKQVTIGFDTKTQKISNLKAGAQIQDPSQLHRILSNTGVFAHPNFQQDTMLQVYQKYEKNGEFGRLYKKMSDFIYNTYKDEIAHAYMEEMYGRTATMFFTTDTGFYSLSQLLSENEFSYELDQKGFELSKDFKVQFEEWGKSEQHFGYNSATWGWISYLKGYAKYKGKL